MKLREYTIFDEVRE